MWLPSLSFLRGLVLALAALATCAPLWLGPLVVAGVDQVSVGTFVFMKSLYAAIMAGACSPIIALHVMATESPASV